MSPLVSVISIFLAFLFVGAPAQADCSSTFKVGYFVKSINGVRTAVWYPAEGMEKNHDYGGGFTGRLIPNGSAQKSCAPFPLVVFSHGLAGCGTQSIFLTEELARRGYVVVAPDHRDALCSSGGGSPVLSFEKKPSILDPKTWNETSFADRRDDIEKVIQGLESTAGMAALIDFTRIGVAGHSVGGYAALGMAGAWPQWKDSRIQAVLALSPYTLPFTIRKTLGNVAVPVMYQGADLDLGITPFLEGGQGAYQETGPPKYFVKLRGGNHFIWTNLQCLGLKTVAACAQTRPEAVLINNYGIAFFDKHLKGKQSALLSNRRTKLSRYEFADI